MYQDEIWHAGRPRPHCLRWGPSSPPQKKSGHSFRPMHVRFVQMAGCIQMPLSMEVGFGPGNCVRWGPSSPPPQTKRRAQPPQFSAYVYCGQTAGWIKMSLGTKVGLGQSDIVFDWDPAPPPKKRRTASPQLIDPLFLGA